MRLKWLQQHIENFTPSKGWRWFYRKGYRKGYAKGREKGRQEGNVVKMCEQHDMPLTLQTVQLLSGTLIEGWFCPMWHEHSTVPTPHSEVPRYPDAQSYSERPYFPEPGERHTDRIPQPNPLQVVNHALRTGAGPHTAVQRAMKTRDLNKWMKEQGEG